MAGLRRSPAQRPPSLPSPLLFGVCDCAFSQSEPDFIIRLSPCYLITHPGSETAGRSSIVGRLPRSINLPRVKERACMQEILR